MRENALHRPRLLITGDQHNGQLEVAHALLADAMLERCTCFHVGLPSLVQDPGSYTPEAALVNRYVKTPWKIQLAASPLIIARAHTYFSLICFFSVLLMRVAAHRPSSSGQTLICGGVLRPRYCATRCKCW